MSKDPNLTIANEVPTLTKQECAEQVRALICRAPWLDIHDVLADAMAFSIVGLLPKGAAQDQLIDLHAEHIRVLVKAFYEFMERKEAAEGDEPHGHA